MAGCEAIFEAAEIGVHNVGIHLQGKDQRDIDIDAGRDGLANGGDAGLGSRYLDHEIGAGDAGPKLLGLSGRGLGIASEERADLDAHVAITTAGFLVERQEQIGCGADVLRDQLPEYLFAAPAGPGKRNEGLIVVRGLGNGLIEDSGIGGHAADVAAVDKCLRLAVLQGLALDIIHPEGLPESCKLFNNIHCRLSCSLRVKS